MRLTLALFLTCLSTACVSVQPIKSVEVRNANFDVIKKLGADELYDFERHWAAKEATELDTNTSRSLLGDEHFKLDIASQKYGGRWLYYTSGYVQLLAIKRKNVTIYKLNDVESFNRLIGVKK